jgi:WD40 repeat protein
MLIMILRSLILLALLSSSVQIQRPIITVENAAQVEQVGVLGRGRIGSVAWRNDDQEIVIRGSTGWIYNANDLSVPPAPYSEAHDIPFTTKTVDDHIQVIEAETGEVKLILPTENLIYLTLSPNEKYVVVSQEGEGTQLWDLALGELYLAIDDETRLAEFSDDEMVFAYSIFVDGNPVIKTLNLETKTPTSMIQLKGQPVNIALSSHFIAVAMWDFFQTSDNAVRLFDLETGEEQLLLVDSEDDRRMISSWWGIWSLAFDSKGSHLVGGSTSGHVAIWEIPSGKVLQRLSGIKAMDEVAFSLNGRRLAAEGGEVLIWDVTTREEEVLLESDANNYNEIFLGHTLEGELVGVDKVNWDKSTNIRPVADSTLRDPYVTFSPDLQMVAYSSYSDEVGAVYDSKTGTLLYRLPQKSAVIFLDNRFLLVRGTQWVTSPLELFDLETQRTVLTLPDTENLSSIAFSKDRTLMATAQGEIIKVWDITKLPKAAALKAEWTIPLNELYASYYLNRYLVFSPDGSILVADNGYDIYLWDTTTGKNLAILKGHNEAIESIAFSPDGTLIATVAYGGLEGAFEALTSENYVRLWGIPRD